MSYKALYRTYRPLAFTEVAGQRHIVRTLENALRSGKIAHAYLFTGPRGTGKTTMAKLFAKALNCEEGVGKQCNVCSNCLAINDGNHPDVIEIDAASNNGVDDIRELIDNVKYSPIKGKYKVYIIDEVHMMTPSAFNALLKTLEEPPSNVIFILATTEPHKVLPTILSRCQRYDFSKVGDEDIRQRIMTILDTENVKYEKVAIDLIISLADGGVRDALSMLDQVLAFSNDRLVEDDILNLFGLAGINEKIALLEAANQHDIKTLLTKANAFIEHGVDIKRLTNDLLNILKDVLVYAQIADTSLLAVLPVETATQLVQNFPMSKIRLMIDILLQAQSDYRYVANIRSLFEVVLLKLSAIDGEIPSKTPVKVTQPVQTEVARETGKGHPIPISAREPHPRPEDLPFNQPSVAPTSAPAVPVVEAPSKVEEPTKKEEKPKLDDGQKLFKDISAKELTDEGESLFIADDSLIGLMCLGDREEKLKLIADWGNLNSILSHPSLGSYGAILKDGHPYILTKDVLILHYDFETVAKRINLIANQKALQKIIERIVGRKVIVYGLFEKERARVQKMFTDLNQLSRLPKKKDIKIEITGSDKI